MENYLATDALHALSRYLMRCYGKKVVILLDEYDTPCRKPMYTVIILNSNPYSSRHI